jgi:hypothetical protein
MQTSTHTHRFKTTAAEAGQAGSAVAGIARAEHLTSGKAKQQKIQWQR